jgi:hypothetical protein
VDCRRFSQPKAFHLGTHLRPYLNFNALNLLSYKDI